MSVSHDTSGRLRAIAVRNIEFYRPSPADVPWELLGRGSASHDADYFRSQINLDYTRISNRIEPAEIIGVYSMRMLDSERFEIVSVAVHEDYEHQLIGRRLLGHALGLAESKAAREVLLAICTDNVRAIETALKYGFVESGAQKNPNENKVSLRFELTPE